MNTLLHLCKKDFTFAKPWIFGTWFALAISNLLPWISPEGEMSLPFMMIRLLAPAVMVFLASIRIIHCDPFVGASGFMGTRPVRPVALLGQKLAFIALVFVLPAVGFALLHAACLRVQLSASDWLLLFIENWLYFSLIAALAVMFSTISRKVGTMMFFLAAGAAILALYGAYFARPRSFRGPLEDEHLAASVVLVAQAFLAAAAVTVAASWAKGRRVWLTVAVFLLGAGFLASIHKVWRWNFVDGLSKQAALEEIVPDKPKLIWQDEPRLVSNRSRESIPYSQLTRPGRVAGLKDGWEGKPVKFQSVARFADGTVWTSEGGSEFHPFDDLTPEILPQLGIEVPENHPLRSYQKFQAWTLFECEKRRLEKLPNRLASVRGTGTFQLYQPYILGDMPATPGASAANGRFRYRLDSVSAFENQISYKISIRGVALNSRGDTNRGFEDVEILLANPKTGKFTNTRGSGGSNRVSADWITIRKSVSLDQQQGTTSHEETEGFLKDARLYILGPRYGGNITLPYEIPQMMLEEKH